MLTNTWRCSNEMEYVKANQRNTNNEAGTSNINTGPVESKTTRILRNVLAFSTCSVVKGPPYLSLVKSSLDGV